MSNSRIKDVPGIPGAKMEAIASTIVIDYNPVDPGKSQIRFAFQDFLTDSNGIPVGMADGKWDLLPCDLVAIMDVETGVPGVGMPEIIAAVKGISDAVHNARAARDAEGAANGQ